MAGLERDHIDTEACIEVGKAFGHQPTHVSWIPAWSACADDGFRDRSVGTVERKTKATRAETLLRELDCEVFGQLFERLLNAFGSQQWLGECKTAQSFWRPDE
jgi:hypothetical protein